MSKWPETALGDVCTVTMGQAPPGESYNDSGDGFPLIAGAGDFGDGVPAAKKFTTAPTKTCDVGDIVMSIRASIGDRILADGIYCLGRGVAGLRPSSRLDVRYLWHWTKSIAEALLAKGRGATFLQVNRADITCMAIPLPPLAEQRRIADILDHADALRAKRSETLRQLDDLTQSVFLDMFGTPRKFVGEASSLTDLCHAYSGATPSKEDNRLWRGTLPWFSPKDLKTTYLSDSIDHIAEALPDETNLRLLDSGTVVIVVRGMILAHTAPVCLLTVPATINQDLKALIPKEPVDPVFLLWSIRAQSREVLSAVSTAAHGTKRLDARALASIRIPRPGPELEQEFAARAEKIRHTRSVAQAAAAELDALFASLQQRAFSGQL